MIAELGLRKDVAAHTKHVRESGEPSESNDEKVAGTSESTVTDLLACHIR
jgi:hypothetical protein